MPSPSLPTNVGWSSALRYLSFRFLTAAGIVILLLHIGGNIHSFGMVVEMIISHQKKHQLPDSADICSISRLGRFSLVGILGFVLFSHSSVFNNPRSERSKASTPLPPYIITPLITLVIPGKPGNYGGIWISVQAQGQKISKMPRKQAQKTWKTKT